MYFALELKWSLGDNLNKYFAKCLQFVLYLYNSYHMACTEGQSYVVELIVNNQFKAFIINLNAQHVNGKTYFALALSEKLLRKRL